MQHYTLTEPTVFADLNKKLQKPEDEVTTELKLHSLKYKHFRDVMKYPEQDQMHYLMIAMTGLTEDDIGELSPNDAAEISSRVFDAMKTYMQLGQKIMKGLDDHNR